MTLENLKTARVMFPGAISILIALGFVLNPFDVAQLTGVSTIFTGVIYVILAVFVGGIYEITNIRWRLLAPSLTRINDSLKLRLLDPFNADPTISWSRENLLRGSTLLDIFYHFVDNDESLKQRSKEVYFNGLIWSTIADVILLSMIGLILYFIAYQYSMQQYYLGIIAVLCVAIILGFLLLGPVESKHIKLGINQVDYIIHHYKSDLHQKLAEAAGR